jgi:molybdopterin-guanine dinucleotide biosynthesis protein B
VEIPPIIIVTGRKNSGKTRLVSKLIPELRKRGVSVGVVKHDYHGKFRWDQKGKDTDLFWESGADAVSLIGPGKYAVKIRTEGEVSLEDFIRQHYQGLDLVLVEGFGRLDHPRIEVVRAEISSEPLFLEEAIAFVTDREQDFARKTFRLDEVGPLVDFILDYLKVSPPSQAKNESK